MVAQEAQLEGTRRGWGPKGKARLLQEASCVPSRPPLGSLGHPQLLYSGRVLGSWLFLRGPSYTPLLNPLSSPGVLGCGLPSTEYGLSTVATGQPVELGGVTPSSGAGELGCPQGLALPSGRSGRYPGLGGRPALTNMGPCALQTDPGVALEGADFLGVAVTPGAAGEQAALGKSAQRSAAGLGLWAGGQGAE